MTAVRGALAEDARAIAEVHVASWRWAYEGILGRETLEALSVDDRATMWRDAIGAADDRSGVLVAQDAEGRVVGFASVGPSADQDATDGTGEVLAIYVDAAFAGSGVGRSLFEAARERLRVGGFERATLWVLEANERARRFYERAGWAWDGTISQHRFDCGNQPVVRYAGRL